MPKISVIVPVYQVEPYLRKCLDSLADQSYRNLELILVDDGSPDGCGAICDAYAAQDSRFKVLHKANGGVSSARNAGLDAATGDYIGWVDPDDWVEPDMFAYLLQNAQTYNADIAVCGRYEVMPTRQVFRGWTELQLLDREGALGQLLEDKSMQNYLWDKLWRRALFDGVRFPEGRTFEDIAVLHRLFARAERVVCLPEGKYYYLQRARSIVGDQRLQAKLNYFTAARQRREEMSADWPQFAPLLDAQCAAAVVGIWCSYYANPRAVRREFRPQLRPIARFAREHQAAALARGDLGLAGRFVLRLTPYPRWWAFALARLVSRMYEKKHGRPL